MTNELMQAPGVPIANIIMGHRIRTIDPKQVSKLKANIQEIGLLHPIVLVRTNDAADGEPTFQLVCGAHRLAACRELGHPDIPATIHDLDLHQRTIAECDENLRGPNLSPVERALLMTARKTAYEALHPTTKRGATGRGRGKSLQIDNSKRFTDDTAEKIGKSEASVQRDVRRGNNIELEIMDQLQNTKFDRGTILDTLAKIDPSQQQAKLDEIKAQSLDTKSTEKQAANGLADKCNLPTQRNVKISAARPSAALKWLREHIGLDGIIDFTALLAAEDVADFVKELYATADSSSHDTCSQPVDANAADEIHPISLRTDTGERACPNEAKLEPSNPTNEEPVEISCKNPVAPPQMDINSPATAPVQTSFEPAENGEQFSLKIGSIPTSGGLKFTKRPSNWSASKGDPRKGDWCKECKGISFDLRIDRSNQKRWQCASCFDASTDHRLWPRSV